MKTHLFFWLMPLVLTLALACKRDIDSPLGKGLVSFRESPAYTAGKVDFEAQIQFSGGGKAITMDFQILDGSSVVRSGKAELKDNPDGLNLFYVSGTISEPIDAATYQGKTLVIFLDPDNKLTLDEYTTTVYVDLYKKESFEVN